MEVGNGACPVAEFPQMSLLGQCELSVQFYQVNWPLFMQYFELLLSFLTLIDKSSKPVADHAINGLANLVCAQVLTLAYLKLAVLIDLSVWLCKRWPQ